MHAPAMTDEVEATQFIVDCEARLGDWDRTSIGLSESNVGLAASSAVGRPSQTGQ